MRFSVLMSVYCKDDPEHFKKALESVSVFQTLPPNQIVIVEDGPVPDEINHMIDHLKSTAAEIEITVIPKPRNAGLAAALNTGLKACKYEWIARMDSDDISLPDRFQKQIDFLHNHPKIDILGGTIAEFQQEPDDLQSERHVGLTHEEIIRMARSRSPMNHVTVLYSKKAVEGVGAYDEDFGKLEDYRLWVELIKSGARFANVDDVLVFVRTGNGFMERRSNRREIIDWDMLQSYLLQSGLINKRQVIKNRLNIRVFTYMPVWMKHIVYQNFLRKRSMKKYKIGYTTGVYDLFHIGHLNILRRAKEQCDYLIVGVTSDALCYACKHKYPVIPFSERMDIVGAIRYVDRVVAQDNMDKLKAVKEYHTDVVFVGSDWQNTPEWNEYEKQFASVGCKVIYLPHTDGTSSTIVKNVLDIIYHNQEKIGWHYLRDNLTDDYGILSLQDSILKIAVYIDKLCREHNINYCLMGGSAIGAVRHGGFIPWDDDLDIFMTPDDFNRFRKVFEESGDHNTFYLQQLLYRHGMVASAKLRLNGTAFIEEATKDWKIHQGIFVDIFLLHHCPDNPAQQFLQCLAAKYLLAKGQSRKNIRYTGIKKHVTAVLRRLPNDFGILPALKRLYKYDTADTSYVCHFMGKAIFRRGIYPSAYFRSYKRLPFEKVELNVSRNTHKYLRIHFGDYMTIPPKASIKNVQHALKWDTEKDYSEYVGKNDKSQERDLV